MPRRSHHQKKALLLIRKLQERLREIELCKCRYVLRDDAHSNAHYSFLKKGVAAEADSRAGTVGKINLLPREEALLALVREELYHKAHRRLRGELLILGERDELAGDAYRRAVADRKVEV